MGQKAPESPADSFAASILDVMSDSHARRCMGLLELVKWRTRAACVAISSVDPTSGTALLIAESDMPQTVADFIVSPSFMQRSAAFQQQLLNASRLNGWDDVGFPDTAEASRAFAPTGFRNGVSMPLLDPTGRVFGLVHANTTRPRFGADARDVLLSLRSTFEEMLCAVQAAQVKRLTAREQDIVRLVRDGYTNAQIAAALLIAERTVATHLENILRKVQAQNRVQAAVWACRVGL